MIQVRAEQYHRALLLEVADQGDAGRFAARINFDFNRLYVAIGPVFQDDGERLHSVNGGFARGQ